MISNPGFGRARMGLCLGALFAVATLAGGQVMSPALPKDGPEQSPGGKTERGREIYHNWRFNFSLAYPSAWRVQEGANRSGMTIRPPDASGFRLPPSLGAGGATGQPNHLNDRCCQTLDQQFENYLGALKEYQHAIDLKVLSKRYTQMAGLRAIDASIQFRDSASGDLWLERNVTAHTKDDGYSFNVGVRCSPTDVRALMPIFEELVESFRILGPPR
jgi:hypothetical protein